MARSRRVIPPTPLSNPSSLARADTLFDGDRIDLNAATPEELCLLPGIGPAMAGRVVELRRQRGRFTHVEELLDVRGIGPKTLSKLKPLVSVR
jgi:competence protein ComEA